MNDDFFFLYVDEIYNPNLSILLKSDRKQIVSSKTHHHFGLSGVIIPTNKLDAIHFDCRSIQEHFYPKASDPILHYSDILSNKDLFADLRLNPSKKAKLVKSINSFLNKSDFKAIFSFVDLESLVEKYGIFKKKLLFGISRIKGMYKSYSAKDYNLYFLTLRFIILEFYEFLSKNKARGIIIAEARGKKEDRDLRKAFNGIIMNGVGKISPKELRALIKDIFIIFKNQNHAGLQIADLLLYPTYDSEIPLHNSRVDHFINYKNLIKRKLYKKDSVRLFP